MSNSFEYIDIILLAMIAGFIFLRLRGILGKKTGFEGKLATKFQKELASMGYKFQFITLAGFHNLNYSTFKLAKAYKEKGMAAYSELQQKEFSAEKDGYSATRHQREVGVSYFDCVSNTVSRGESSTTAMQESTEKDQF